VPISGDKLVQEQFWDALDEPKQEEPTPRRLIELQKSQLLLAEVQRKDAERRAANDQRIADTTAKRLANPPVKRKTINRMRALHAKGLNLVQIAEKLKVGVATVGRYVKGYKKKEKEHAS